MLDAGIFSTQAPSASPLNGVFDLLTLLPSLAVSVRRLHDINRTGWWILIAFSIIGIFVLIYWACNVARRVRTGSAPIPSAEPD
jgi:uncharacterized membrane protein YhaH (DUF805 family)